MTGRRIRAGSEVLTQIAAITPARKLAAREAEAELARYELESVEPFRSLTAAWSVRCCICGDLFRVRLSDLGTGRIGCPNRCPTALVRSVADALRNQLDPLSCPRCDSSVATAPHTTSLTGAAPYAVMRCLLVPRRHPRRSGTTTAPPNEPVAVTTRPPVRRPEMLSKGIAAACPSRLHRADRIDRPGPRPAPDRRAAAPLRATDEMRLVR